MGVAGGIIRLRVTGDAAKRGVELDSLLKGVVFHSEHFRELVEALPVALYTTDADGRITYFNAAAEALWGRAPVLGEEAWCGSWKLYWPDGRPMAHDECPMAQTLKTGNPVLGVKAIAERPDGTRFLFAPYPSPLFGPSGELTGAINMLFDISEWEAPEKALQHLAAIVQNSEDAIISKNLDGTITSWNAAAERLFGYKSEEIVGRSILVIIPEERRSEEAVIINRIRRGERIEHYETVRKRKNGTYVDVSLTVSPVKDRFGHVLGASKIARDISERKAQEELLKRQTRRLATLYRVSRILPRDLDLDRIVQSVVDVGTELSGAKFGAFLYNAIGEDGENRELCAYSGVPVSAYSQIDAPWNSSLLALALDGDEIIRSDDIRNDPRHAQSAPDFGMSEGLLPVTSYLAVPVVASNGTVLGGLFFGHDELGVFQEETESLIAAIALQAAVAIDNARLHRATEAEIAQRRRAERTNEFLINEIKHRVKNTLGTVQAIAVQTFRNAPPEERNAFIARLHALAGAHDLLTQREWGHIALSEMTARALSPFVDKKQSRIASSGADVDLSPNRALLIAMVLHELGTNAVKYGALSNDVGTVELAWGVAEKNGTRMLRLDWSEQGGPEVARPRHKGFGSRMIDHAIRGEQGVAEFAYAPQGLRCHVEIAI